jgi:hypothetical protein
VNIVLGSVTAANSFAELPISTELSCYTISNATKSTLFDLPEAQS